MLVMPSENSLSILERAFLFALLILLAFLLILSLIMPVFYTLVIMNFFLLFALVFFMLLYIEKKPDWGKAKLAKKFHSISILIPVYNSKRTIKQCIDSVKAIQYPSKLEIVVVDDGSTDGTREYLEKVKGIKLIKLKKNSGKAIALNTGLKHIKTEFVACIDSDTYPEKEIFMKLSGYLEEEKVGAITCLILPDKKASLIQKIQFFEYATGLEFGLLYFLQ